MDPSTASSSSIEEMIKKAAARNKELLQILAETDRAVPALEQHRRYVADLQKEYAGARHRVAALDEKRQKELREHEKYRDSVMRRFAFKVTGKGQEFNERAAKEEQEYFGVLQEEHQAKEMMKTMEDMLAHAQQASQELEQNAAQNRQAQTALDGLYNAIFAGPTPGFPDEDEKESFSAQKLQDYHNARIRVEAEDQVISILTDAQSMMRDALFSMQDALRHSRFDIFGGGTFHDMMERNALSRAEFSITSARVLVSQAQRMSAAVGNLPPVRIAQGHLLSDVFFDKIYTDMDFHDRIRESNVDVEMCAAQLNRKLDQARMRRSHLSADLREKEKELEEARIDLQKTREAAFERIAGGKAS